MEYAEKVRAPCQPIFVAREFPVRELECAQERLPPDFWTSALSTESGENNYLPHLGDSAVAR